MNCYKIGLKMMSQLKKTSDIKNNRKTIVIVGGTREAACQRLKRIAPNDGIMRREWYDEVTLDNHCIIALGGEIENVCFLIALGYNRISEIIVVNEDGVSEKMRSEIRFVRSAKKVV